MACSNPFDPCSYGVEHSLGKSAPLQTVTFEDKSLFVPKALLPKSEPDLVNLVRDHLSQAVTNRLELVQYADDLLQEDTMKDEEPGNSSIIWTIELLEHPLTVSLPDLAKDTETDLYKAQVAGEFSSLIYADSSTNPSWIASCVEFRTIRPDDSWGRCSHEYALEGFLVRLHYDGRLIRQTGAIAAASQRLLQDWLQQPE